MLKVIEYETPRPIHNTTAAQYIVFESVSYSVSKVIHVINLAKNRTFFFGRGQEANVRVTDISVSRLHASVFKSAQGYYYLCDNKSKFGTLI
jgi:pSer/pThr/pTyr-binding forkhead associated (FHA) protein